MINNTLLNMISPSGIEFEKTKIQLGDVALKGLGVIKYPNSINYGWLSEVCNIPSTITSITYTPSNNEEEILKDIGKQVSNHKMIAEGITSSDPLEITRAKKLVNDGEEIISKIANQGHSVGLVSTNILAITDNEKDIGKVSEGVSRKFSGKLFKTHKMSFFQKENFESISPFNLQNENSSNITDQIIPIQSLLGGFPLSSSGYNDVTGVYYGKDSSGGLIIVDTWKRGADRTNSNLVFMGTSGSGKTTALMHLMLSEYELGTKIIIIDPQGEFKTIVEKLDGDYIDVIGGSHGRINPFHIYEKMKTDKENENLLAIHIQQLEVFFKMYIDLDTILSGVLKECIEETYKKKGIEYSSNILKLSSDSFPVMEDLYNIIIKKSELADINLRASEINYYKQLSYLIRASAIGSDKFLFNGHSTINISKDFVVFDTQKLQAMGNNIKSAIYYNILTYAQDLLTKNKNERVVLICDEAHYMIDKRVPESLSLLAKIEKTVRKYSGALWIASQQIIDFLADEIKKDGQAILEQSNIRVLMGVGKGQDLKDLKNVYELTDAEEELLNQQEIGKGILMIGKRRLSISFQIPTHHLELMDKIDMR
ncbi:MAG: DUF87 domain-containing protein [Oscillospiraceae bacterium]|nr:DUF87 domain-containing protein [Oscillospiraceae bacterium]